MPENEILIYIFLKKTQLVPVSRTSRFSIPARRLEPTRKRPRRVLFISQTAANETSLRSFPFLRKSQMLPLFRHLHAQQDRRKETNPFFLQEVTEKKRGQLLLLLKSPRLLAGKKIVGTSLAQGGPIAGSGFAGAWKEEEGVLRRLF